MLNRAAIESLFRSGLSRALARRLGGLGAIYMFHRVIPDRSTCLAAGLSTSTRFLNRLLASFRRAEIDVIGIDDVMCRLRDNDGRRFVVATFDDGYADNLYHALPIFEKHNVPLTVYVTTGTITRTLYCWWAGLERLFLARSDIEIAAMGRRWSVDTLFERERAFEEASRWVSEDITARAPTLQPTFSQYGLSLPMIVDGIGLTLEQLKSLGSHPLVTIGGHTESHPELPRLPHAAASSEINANKQFLENALQTSVDHFAYPYGAFGERETVFAKDAGYKTAVTTRSGCLFERDQERPHVLPRLGSSPYESLGLAHLKIDGFVSALQRR